MADTKVRAMIFRQVTNFSDASDASTLFTNSTSPTVSVDEGEAGDESSLASFNLEQDWFIPFWIVLCAFWLMYPCLSNRRRRRRWWRRLKERRWDISEGGIAPGRATTDSLAFEIWGEEAPLLRSALTDILLREFTKVRFEDFLVDLGLNCSGSPCCKFFNRGRGKNFVRRK